MTRTDAIRKLEKLYGKGKAYARVLNEITSPEKRAEAHALYRQIERASGAPHCYKFTIGRSGGIFNEITGHGDTWEEAFAQAEKRTT